MSKRESNEVDGNPNNFMLIRQYTTKTNNDNSIDPHDVDNYMDGLRDSPLLRRTMMDPDANMSEDGGSMERMGGGGIQRHNSEDVDRNRRRGNYDVEDAEFNRAIHESLMASNTLYVNDDDATCFDPQASTEALKRIDDGKQLDNTHENSKKSGFSPKRSPRKDSPVVMFGEENCGGRSMTKLGTIVLSNVVESVPAKDIIMPNSSSTEEPIAKEYLPAAGAFAVPVNTSKRASGDYTGSNGLGEKSGEVSASEV